MTMIAVATYGDHAEFITDTLSYNKNCSSLGTTTKHAALAHIDAAVLTQGDSGFGVAVKVESQLRGHQEPTFDELADAAPAWLQMLWDNVQADQPDYDMGTSFVVLVGYSTGREEFVAYLYDSEHAFSQTVLEQTFVFPSPFSLRPSELELERFAAHDTNPERWTEVKAAWLTKPTPTRPITLEDWGEIAFSVRGQRALQRYGHIGVGGSVIHTVLDRGLVVTRTIIDFRDEGEEFEHLVAWTEHPVSQLMACHCGSGKTFRDCHLEAYYAEPGRTCGCESGKAFADCCRVGDAQAAVQLGPE